MKVKIILSSIVLIIVVSILGFWTYTYKIQKENESFERKMASIVKENGVEDLLNRSGLKVRDIYFSDDGIDVFLKDDSDYRYSLSERENIYVFEKAKVSVIYITSYSQSQIKTGSGIILSKDGYILTNKHVIEGANSIEVKLIDDRILKAKLIGFDNETDLAVLKIEANDLTAFKLLKSDWVVVGQKVIAIANPRGFERSLTTGVVSGLARPIRDLNKGIILDMIQTDALVSKGSSGGALLDNKGRLIGLITSMESSSGIFEATSFAVPVNTIIDVVSQLIEFKEVKRGWVDFEFINLDERLKEYGKLPTDKGLLVTKVDKEGKLKVEGSKVMYKNKSIQLSSDIITKVNNQEVNDFSDFYILLSASKPGDDITLSILRNKKEIQVNMKLIERGNLGHNP